MTPGSQSLLDVSGLSRVLDTRTLWQDVRFGVRAGESVALTGPSGSGKSLLLRAMSALDPLESGEVRLLGRTPGEWGVPGFRARVMLVPQRPVLYGGTVLEGLRAPFGLKVHAGRAFREEEATSLLAALSRDVSFLTLGTDSLSGGEAQVFALLRALLLSPSVLLLDEVTSALDPDAARAAETLLLGWVAAGPDRALVWVSHSPEQRARVAGRELNLRAWQAHA
ncbi:ABC transporter ATP-binding protein [Deinococcus aquiradiocola]|uniref:ABC transporter ATP-binding protein n=1 Tax=Deinococcus aquiradiocola TaxID=393059 RepID=A0A917PG32_9DEIO|nr:ATP-binding cassette domain-containing protein [Deinococcus aquiradiocola]GGJ76252.1 ABC transporter ATP-binding protein [Deinococcus aquiradiocola]